MKEPKDISQDFIDKKYIQLLEQSNINLHKKTNPFAVKNIFIYSALFSFMFLLGIVFYLNQTSKDIFEDQLIATQYNTKHILLETQEGVFYQITNNTNKKWLAANGVFVNVTNEAIRFTNTKKISNKWKTRYTLYTPKDKQYKLTNADGTKIQLNANTKLTFTNTRVSKTTNATLDGEAFFEVAHNPKEPFSISASDMHVAVFGTAFNISNFKQNKLTSLSLVNGSVKVGLQTNKSLFIKPGEQVVLDSNKHLAVRAANFSKALAWRSEYLYFNDESLESITEKVSAWFPISFVFQNNTLKKIQFTGSLTKENGLLHFLEMLKYTEGIDYRISDKEVVLLKIKSKNN